MHNGKKFADDGVVILKSSDSDPEFNELANAFEETKRILSRTNERLRSEKEEMESSNLVLKNKLAQTRSLLDDKWRNFTDYCERKMLDQEYQNKQQFSHEMAKLEEEFQHNFKADDSLSFGNSKSKKTSHPDPNISRYIDRIPADGVYSSAKKGSSKNVKISDLHLDSASQTRKSKDQDGGDNTVIANVTPSGSKSKYSATPYQSTPVDKNFVFPSDFYDNKSPKSSDKLQNTSRRSRRDYFDDSSSSDSDSYRSRRTYSGRKCHDYSNSDSSSSESSSSSSSPISASSRRRPRRVREKSPPVPKMATFNGESANWKSFYFQFKQFSKMYKWDRKTKLQRLMTCLRGRAVEFVESRPSRICKNYKLLKRELIRRFGQKDPPNNVRKQLQNLKQEEFESFDDFADRTYSLTIEGFPKTSNKTIQGVAVDVFLRGCKDKTAAYSASEKDPKNIYQALKYVKSSVYNQKLIGKPSYMSRQVSFQTPVDNSVTKNDSNSLFDSSIRKLGDTLNQFSAAFKAFSDSSPGKTHASNPSTHRCYNCGSYGHFMKDCPHPKKPTSPPNSPSPRSPSPSPIQCFNCKDFGHIQKDCPKKLNLSRTPSPMRKSLNQ